MPLIATKEMKLPDGRWFLKNQETNEWQFFAFLDFGYAPTVYHRFGEPYPEAAKDAIADGRIVK